VWNRLPERHSFETEPFREKFGDVGLLLAVSALKENDGVGAEFVDHLAAGAAGGAGDALIVDDRDRGDLDLGTQSSHGRKNRGALGAIRHSVGGVLYVAAGEDFAFCSEQSGTHSEVGVGGVGVLHRRPGGLEQAFTLQVSGFPCWHRLSRYLKPGIAGLIVNRERGLQDFFCPQLRSD